MRVRLARRPRRGQPVGERLHSGEHAALHRRRQPGAPATGSLAAG